MENFFTSPSKMPKSAYPPNPLNTDPSQINVGRATTNDVINVRNQSQTYLIQDLSDGQTPFCSTYERIGGGTLWHWLGTSLRLLPGDFKTKSLFGHGRDWPIPYSDMEPLYARAEREMGVAGDVSAQTYMDGLYPPGYEYPMPGMTQSYLDDTMKATLDTVTLFDEPMDVRRRRSPATPFPTMTAGSAPATRTAFRSARSRRSTTPRSRSTRR